MPTRQRVIEQRLDAGQRIVLLVRGHAFDCAQRVMELVPYYAKKGASSIELLLEDQAHLLDLANAQLARAHVSFQRVAESVDHDAQQWTVLEEVAVELEFVIAQARQRLGVSCGVDMLMLYGMEEHPPAGFRALATYAYNAIILLGAHPQSLGGRFGDTLETVRIIEMVQRPLGALNAHLVGFDAASSELKAALQTRDLATEEWMRVWRAVCSVLEGVFLMAQCNGLAAQVRPSVPALGSFDL